MTTKEIVKRQKEIKIRLTDEEHQALLDRCTTASLASWMRESCLNEKRTKQSKVIEVDPKLLRQLAGIGNNLNQIARLVNHESKANSAIDRIAIITALSGIERELQGCTMIIKIHSRGIGSGSAPVDYLLGKDRDREDARLDRGDPEQMIQLIDSSNYAQKYTSGVLSFAERDLEEHQKQQIMDSFERALMPGLDKDQYSVLWVQHQDKDRLELNFVVANVELQSGKRLQPYFDRADRPRVNAWKDLVNDHYDLKDPNDPLNKRELCTPNNLPRTKILACEAITDGLLSVAERGDLKDRDDVIKTLEGAGFEIARTTKKSISIKDPDGGKIFA